MTFLTNEKVISQKYGKGTVIDEIYYETKNEVHQAVVVRFNFGIITVSKDEIKKEV